MTDSGGYSPAVADPVQVSVPQFLWDATKFLGGYLAWQALDELRKDPKAAADAAASAWDAAKGPLKQYLIDIAPGMTEDPGWVLRQPVGEASGGRVRSTATASLADIAESLDAVRMPRFTSPGVPIRPEFVHGPQYRGRFAEGGGTDGASDGGTDGGGAAVDPSPGEHSNQSGPSTAAGDPEAGLGSLSASDPGLASAIGWANATSQKAAFDTKNSLMGEPNAFNAVLDIMSPVSISMMENLGQWASAHGITMGMPETGGRSGADDASGIDYPGGAASGSGTGAPGNSGGPTFRYDPLGADPSRYGFGPEHSFFVPAASGGGLRGAQSRIEPTHSHAGSGRSIAGSRGGGRLVDDPSPGRADLVKTSVAANSYVIPADVVSGLGQGNTDAGAGRLRGMLANVPPHRPAVSTNRVPVALSGGEYLVPPEIVAGLGGGSTDTGMRVLERLIAEVRRRVLLDTSRLKPPKR
jgi:hypothetical protein